MKRLCVKGMRRCGIVFFVFCMILSMGLFPRVAEADSVVKLEVSSCTVEKGGMATISFLLSENPGLWGLKLKVEYNNEEMALEAVEMGNVFAPEEVLLPDSLVRGTYTFYAARNVLENTTENGVLLSLGFLVGSETEAGAYPVILTVEECFNVDGEDVIVEVAEGNVTVVNCFHRESYRKVIEEPTCEGEGVASEICSECNEVLSTERIAATGHTTTEIRGSVAATINMEGYSGDSYCVACGTLIETGTVLPKLACTHESTSWSVTQKATCEKRGTKIRTCKVCKETVETQVVPATGHQHIEVKNAVLPTELEEGYTGDTFCADCGKVISKGSVLPKQLCTHKETETQMTKEPTCEETGTEITVCLICSLTTETKVIAAKGHGATELKEVVPATEEAEGYTGDTYCTECGVVVKRGRVLPKLTPVVTPESKPEQESESGQKPEQGTEVISKNPPTEAEDEGFLVFVLVTVLCCVFTAVMFFKLKSKKKTNVERNLDLYTKEDLKICLKNMGLKTTDALMVHSSMKAIGDVDGGADTVVDAFMEYFTDGLFMTPTHTWAQMSKEYATYNPATEPACVGIIPNIFRQREGVVRSLHPTHSIAAYGKGAAEYIKGEENATTPCPPGGCWDRLREIDAKILLLGVTHTRNTYIHSVDEVLNIKDRLTEEPTLMHIVMPDGSLKDVQMHRHYNSTLGTGNFSEEFDKLMQAFYSMGAAKPVKFGDADCILCEAKKIFEVCEKLFSIEENCVIERETIPREWWK